MNAIDGSRNNSQRERSIGGRKGIVMRPAKTNARREYRLKQREQTEGSPVMADKYPRLKAVKVTLTYFDAGGTTHTGEMKCKWNVKQARSVVWIPCRGGECVGGDFDLSQALAEAVAGRHKVASGELRCQGRRKRGDREVVPCEALLRYKLILDYD